MLHLRRLARHVEQGDLTHQDLAELVREPYYVPEATPLNIQLVNFQRRKRRSALVVDEYGDVQGLVDAGGHPGGDRRRVHHGLCRQLAGNSVRPALAPTSSTAAALLRDINRTLGWRLPTDGPKTLNGLVVEALETIPKTNVCLRIDRYLIETLQIKDNVIKPPQDHGGRRPFHRNWQTPTDPTGLEAPKPLPQQGAPS